MTACVRGCVVPGDHAPPCTCTRDCRDHDAHCGGCRPADTDRGLLCRSCASRLADHLGASEDPTDERAPHDMPWAWQHLAQFIVPTVRPVEGGGRQELPVPVSLAVLDLRDEIRDWLGETTADLATRLNLAGPAGIRLSDDWRVKHVGRDWHIVRRCAQWLLAHLDQLAAGAGLPDEDTATEAACGAWTGAADLMSRAHALAPWRPAPTEIPGIPCRCGAVALHDHGDVVKCWSCMRIMDREEYRVLTTVFARRFADDPRALLEHQRGRLQTSSAGVGGRP